MVNYKLDLDGAIKANNTNAILLASTPAKQAKTTTKNYIVGFMQPNGIRIKYDRQYNLLVTYMLKNNEISIMSCSIERQEVYEKLLDMCNDYKRLEDEY